MKKDRVFTEEELKEMGTPTYEAAIAAVERGDKEKALEFIKRMRTESRGALNVYTNWVVELMDYIYVHDGEEALEKALRKFWERLVDTRIEAHNKADFRGRVQARAGALRGLLQPLKIEEDDEKVCIKMEPCGTGQKLLWETGAYDPPRNLSRMKPHRLTWSVRNFPIYCAHGPMEEIIAIEKMGYPLAVHWFPDEVSTESCRFCIYKEPKDIPEEVYKRVGKQKPK